MARLEPAIANGSLLKLYRALWAPYYEAALQILGSTGTILALGDPAHGQPTATTFTTKGEEQAVFTWSEAPHSFDTALDLTDPASFQGIIPVVSLNGTDEEADTPDAAYWSRDDSGSNPLSVGAWVWMTNTATQRDILSKWKAGGKLDAIDARVRGIERILLEVRLPLNEQPGPIRVAGYPA